MKRSLPVLLLCLIVASAAAQDTLTHFGIKTGLNLSIFSASVNSEASFKPGFHVGVYAKHPMGRSFYFRPELYFSSQGQKEDYNFGGSATTTVNYINAPVLFEAGRKISFQFGGQLGVLLSAKEEGTENADLKKYMRPLDFSFVLGFGVQPTEHFSFGARANIGMTDIFDGDDDNFSVISYPDVKNRVFHFYLGYSF